MGSYKEEQFLNRGGEKEKSMHALWSSIHLTQCYCCWIWIKAQGVKSWLCRKSMTSWVFCQLGQYFTWAVETHLRFISESFVFVPRCNSLFWFYNIVQNDVQKLQAQIHFFLKKQLLKSCHALSQRWLHFGTGWHFPIWKGKWIIS